MQNGVLTVGTQPVLVPIVTIGGNQLKNNANNGMRLLCRVANTGQTYIGTNSSVTTSTGNLLPQGDPTTSIVYTIPAEHFNNGGQVWLVGSGSGQLVDWSYD